MNWYRKLFRKSSIRVRLLVGCIVLPLLVMIGCFLLYYNFSVHFLIERNREASIHSVTMVEEIFHLNMMRLEGEMNDLSEQAYIHTLLHHETDKKAKETLDDYVLLNMSEKHLDSFILVDKNHKIIYQKGSYVQEDESHFHANLSKEWYHMPTMHGIYLKQQVYEGDELIGYILGGYKQEAFSPAFTNISQVDNLMIIVDENDRYIFGHTYLDQQTMFELENDVIQVGNNKYYIQTKKITNTDWMVVNLVSKNYVLEEIHSTRNMLMLYMFVILFLETILSTMIYHSIYDPMEHILISMRELDEHNLISCQVNDDGNDELHELSTNFNALLKKVDELVTTVAQEQEQKRMTQIQLLQAQINPHFLFNTLNTLRSLAIINEDLPVRDGIGALSKLLRNTIIDSNEYVNVEEEIENVKNYIIIQKLRYGDLFETVYNIDDKARHCQIVKFLLQPIVENSILHAFEEDREHQILSIRVQLFDTHLQIEIGDNGKGFSQAEISHKHTKLSGIGIENIRDRIHLMYGEPYAMNIQSEVGKGTIVCLKLPIRKEES